MNQEEGVVTIMQKAKQVLVEKGWTQGGLAHDCEGFLVPCNDASAARFCMLGAVYFAVGNDDRQALGHGRLPWNNAYPSVLFEVTRCLTQAIYDVTDNVCSDITIFNDLPGRKKAECLEVYDMAIALAKKGGGYEKRPSEIHRLSRPGGS